MNAISSIAAAAAVTAFAALAPAAFAGTTDNPDLCRAEQVALQADASAGVSTDTYTLHKTALDACLSQRKMDNTGTRRDEQAFHHRAVDVTARS